MDDESGESMNWARKNWRDWCVVDGGEPGVDSRDEGKPGSILEGTICYS